jgi:ribosome-binding factor A
VKAFSRTDRIGTELRRELAQLLRDQVRDPRLANITVHEVRVTRDLAHAKVFFTCFPSAEPVEKSPPAPLFQRGEKEKPPLEKGGLGGFNAQAQERLLNGRLAGFLRHALAQTVQLRTIPQLHFVFDTSIGYGERLSVLIDQAVATESTEQE